MSYIQTISIGVEDSKIIKDAIYFPKVESLMVRFQTDKIYAYFRVPLTVIIDLISFEDFGTAFNKIIKAGGFEFVKIEEAGMIESYLEVV